MAVYGLGVRTINITLGTAAAELATTTTSSARVLEVGTFLTAATTSTLGLGRSGAVGVGPVLAQGGELEDPSAKPSLANVAVQWGITQPTAPVSSNYLRRFTLQAGTGLGVIYTFPRGVLLTASNVAVGLSLINLVNTTILEVNMVWDE